MSAARLALASLVCLLLSAEHAISQPAEPGFYAGVRAGTAVMDTPTVRDREGPGLQGYDRRDTMWSVFGGHDWRIRTNVLAGVEVGYADNGAATITYASSNAYAFRSTQLDLLGALTAQFRRMAVGVKAGVGRTREQYRISTYVSGTPDLTSERTKDLPVVALALSYTVTARVAFLVDARRTLGEVADTVTKAPVSSNPTPPPYRDILNSVSRVTALSVGVKVAL